MGFLVTTSGLKRALGRVVGQITDALTALHQSLSGDIAAAEQQSNAAISAEATARQQGDAAEAAARASAVTDIWDLIPSNASAANSLATQLF
ncbi:MAG: hypothetical protein LBJ11_09195, partial [Oscillospiraceae bacterium]|nr:hypothetical protein [Oscillospiraceae bacterium]